MEFIAHGFYLLSYVFKIRKSVVGVAKIKKIWTFSFLKKEFGFGIRLFVIVEIVSWGEKIKFEESSFP